MTDQIRLIGFNGSFIIVLNVRTADGHEKIIMK